MALYSTSSDLPDDALFHVSHDGSFVAPEPEDKDAARKPMRETAPLLLLPLSSPSPPIRLPHSSAAPMTGADLAAQADAGKPSRKRKADDDDDDDDDDDGVVVVETSNSSKRSRK